MLSINQFSKAFRRVVSGNYLPELDGLRFIAILLVLMQHLSERLLRKLPAEKAITFADSELAFLLSRGTSGVFLFFVISGFILALPYARKARAGKAFGNLAPYYKRRLTRIEPPYFIWMTIFAVVFWWVYGGSVLELAKHWLASIFYVHNFIYESYAIINPVAWSLEVEIQFYLIAPFLAWFFFKKIQKNRLEWIGLAIVLCIPLQTWLGTDTMPWKASLANCIQYFFLGFFLVELYLRKVFEIDHSHQLKWDVLGLLSLPAWPWLWSTSPALELVFIGALGVFFVAAFKGLLLRKLLRSPLLTTIGGMCYTIYLIHLPFMEAWTNLSINWIGVNHYGLFFLMQFLLAGAVLLVLTGVSFLLIEKPFMQKNNSWLPMKTYRAWINGIKKPVLRQKQWIKLLLIISILGWSKSSLAQNVDATAIDDPSFLQLQPLPALLDVALKGAPAITAKDIEIEVQRLEIMKIKRAWLDHIQVVGNYLLNDGLYLDAVETLTNNDYYLTNRKNRMFNLGVVFKLPLSKVANRSLQIKQQRKAMDLELIQKQELENEIRHLVQEVYEEIRLQQRLLRIHTKSLETNRLSMELAEAYFKSGTKSLEAYHQIANQTLRSEEMLVNTQSRLAKSIYFLKELCGDKIFIK